MKLKIRENQQVWFTSDTHYDHKNICSATTSWNRNSSNVRVFDTLDKMNDTLVNNINENVSPNDILFHLGDWSFNGFDNIEKFRNRINCQNIHFILGNHDHHIENNKHGIQSLFSSVNRYLELEISLPQVSNQEKIKRFGMVLMHFPISSWNNMSKGWWHLHGHVHLPPHQRISQGKAMDVGVDGNHLKPVSLRSIMDIMNKQPISKLSLPKDHHEEN